MTKDRQILQDVGRELKVNPPKELAKTARKSGSDAAKKQRVAILLSKARARGADIAPKRGTPQMITGGLPIDAGAVAVIDEILATAGIATCEATSLARSPEDQGRVMFENCVKSAVEQYQKLYAGPGDQVIALWAKLVNLNKDAIVAAMVAKIKLLGPSTVSKHCAGPESLVWVIDIGPSSIPVAKHAAFLAAAKAHPRVTKVLEPPTDPAFHLEILKALAS